MTHGRDLDDLAQYRADERAGLLVRLPVPPGSRVWRVRENPACHSGVRQAERFLFGKVCTPRWIVEPIPFALALLEDWGKTIFQTEDEGRQFIENVNKRTGSGST